MVVETGVVSCAFLSVPGSCWMARGHQIKRSSTLAG